jgi:hypothetical protein
MKESVLEFRRRVLPPDHPHIAVSLYNISLSYEQASDSSRALVCAREALAIRQATLPPDHPDLQDAKKRVAHLAKRP